MPRWAWFVAATLLGPMPGLIAWGTFALLLGASENRSVESFILPMVLTLLIGQFVAIRIAYRFADCPDGFGLVAYAAAVGLPTIGALFTYRELAGLPMLAAWYRGQPE